MIINTKGVELSEAKYLDKEGEFLFKLEKWEEDGFTQEGAAKFKIFFKGVEVGKKEPVYLHSEMFNLQQNSLWRIKQLEVALKAPEVYEVDDLMARYVVVTIKSREYTKNNGETGTAYNVTSWTYSSLNDKLPPIKEAIENNNDVGTEAVEISEDEIPF